jgi:hypothetical protein
VGVEGPQVLACRLRLEVDSSMRARVIRFDGSLEVDMTLAQCEVAKKGERALLFAGEGIAHLAGVHFYDSWRHHEVGIHVAVPGVALRIWLQCQSKMSGTSASRVPRICSGEFMSGRYFALNFWSLLERRPEVTGTCKRRGEWGSKASRRDCHTLCLDGGRLLHADLARAAIDGHEM